MIGSQFEEAVKLMLSFEQDEQIHIITNNGKDFLYFIPFNFDVSENKEWMQLLPRFRNSYFKVLLRSEHKDLNMDWGVN
jgi:hypothetical protein